LRRKYLEFFKSKNHLVYPSASLKSDDPGLMFNVAGMQQFKLYFQGATPRFPGVEGVWPRVTTSQKCMRAGGKDSDIENVGRTRRHHTFFEMLGNFSFGDYFKREAILWAWEFLTSPEWLGLPPERLYATVFTDDDEAYDIWRDEVGIPKERLSRFGEGENFWPANAIKDERSGPCGPCSEIFYDRGPAFGSPDETGPNTGSGDRYIEIWNLVFTQYDLHDSVLTPLPQKNIDTGGGLERFATVISGAQDAYATELFQPTIRRLVELSGVPY
jgi:alanyl-tRNA synthetase